MTKAQVREFSEAFEEYEKPLDSVRLEALRDAYVRVVFVSPDGDAADETVLYPV